MRSLQRNKTWDLVNCLDGKKLVRCRWMCVVNFNANDAIEINQSNVLVAKRYRQAYGISYIETFAPLTKSSTISIVVSSCKPWLVFTTIWCEKYLLTCRVV